MANCICRCYSFLQHRARDKLTLHCVEGSSSIQMPVQRETDEVKQENG